MTVRFGYDVTARFAYSVFRLVIRSSGGASEYRTNQKIRQLGVRRCAALASVALDTLAEGWLEDVSSRLSHCLCKHYRNNYDYYLYFICI